LSVAVAMTAAVPVQVEEFAMMSFDTPAWVRRITDTVFRPGKTKDASVQPDTPLDGSQWQSECERAVRILSNLLQLAGRRQTASAVIELMRTAPRTPEELDKVLTDSLVCRSVKEAFDRVRPSDRMMFDEVCGYISDLTTMPPSRRSMLEASVAGTFLGWGMGGS
jgi:hypothetical protein